MCEGTMTFLFTSFLLQFSCWEWMPIAIGISNCCPNEPSSFPTCCMLAHTHLQVLLQNVFFFFKESLGFEFSLLDIGGGFPGCNSANDMFIDIARTTNECIKDLFSDYPNLNVLAEPGTDVTQNKL